MKNLLIILSCFLFSLSTSAQNRIRGVVKNENGRRLPKVLVYQSSGQVSSYTDSDGRFEIYTPYSEDTLSFSLDNYQTAKLVLNVSDYHDISLKQNLPNNKALTSFSSRDQSLDAILLYGGETYSSLVENPEVSTEQSKSVSFTVNTNRAAYSNIRRFINMDSRVPSDAVRIEEMLNYFNFNYNDPAENELFRQSSVIAECPWNETHKLMFVSVAAKTLDFKNVPPSNFVFLLDVSGSMDLPNRLPLIKSGIRLLVKNLRNIDTVSLVTYGKSIDIVFEGLSGSKKDSISKAVENLVADGNTPGEAGLKLAYKVAIRKFMKTGNNRIILATDGDFNVGVSSEKELEKLIVQEGNTGIQLTCLGVGMGNYKDSKLYLLAQKGHGNFSYLDNEKEAEKVLVTEFTQTLFTVAEDVYLSLTFDSSVVREFRLIGYDNKRSALEDTASELEGGEIGSGHSLLVMFELAMRESISEAQTVANLTIHYQMPGRSFKLEKTYNCLYNVKPFRLLDPDLKKATNIAMLGMKLKNSVYSKPISWPFIEKYAKQVFNKKIPMEAQYLELINKARKIYKRNVND